MRDVDLFNVCVVLVVITIVLFAVLGMLGLGESRGESTYSGVVVDAEYEKGLLFQTTTLHLKTNAQASSTEQFCVKIPGSEETFAEAEQALANGSRVQVTYSRPHFVPIWECDNDTSIVREITVMNNST